VHSTNFKARPDEILKGSVLMPLERAGQRLRGAAADFKKKIKGFTKRSIDRADCLCS